MKVVFYRRYRYIVNYLSVFICLLSVCTSLFAPSPSHPHIIVNTEEGSNVLHTRIPVWITAPFSDRFLSSPSKIIPLIAYSSNADAFEVIIKRTAFYFAIRYFPHDYVCSIG